MDSLLFLIPGLPLAGFAAIVLARRLPRAAVQAIGVGVIAASLAVSIGASVQLMASPPAGGALTQHLWRWLDAGRYGAGATPLVVDIGLRLDALSAVMALVVTFVSLMIHVYSAAFMAGENDRDYGRFFAYLNLFVASMLILSMADNLLLLFLGWEGVGLCSYLLIGFWYTDPTNIRAATKAFVVTRVGDAAMAIGLVLVFVSLGTLNIVEIADRAASHWATGSTMPVVFALLLVAGAVGKSAQLPLQTWLPDAMAGPTPVSALIHAATMVTAGVYLLVRMNAILTLAPAVGLLVAIIGAVTLVLAGASATAQTDIKRVLAYSTISQIGYMFLGIGVGAYGAAMFHLVTHACFKSLLFLGAGVVIHAMGGEHDIFKMGGLRRKLPVVWVTFLIGGLSMSAVPPGIAGFFSKDWIVFESFVGPRGAWWLWVMAVVGVLLTALYTFRLIFQVFHGPVRGEPHRPAGWGAMLVPILALTVPAALIGWLQTPGWMAGIRVFTDFLGRAVPVTGGDASMLADAGSSGVSVLVSLVGIGIAWWLMVARPETRRTFASTPQCTTVHAWWKAGWGFDWAYDALLVGPYRVLAHLLRGDPFDRLWAAVAWCTEVGHGLLSLLQTGNVRWYAAGVGFGAVVLIALVMVL